TEPVTLTELLRASRRSWHGVKLDQPDWSDDSHSLAVTAEMPGARIRLHAILNAYWEPLDFELPPPGPWRRRIDTFLDTPDDIVEWTEAPVVEDGAYRVQPRSVVVLFAAMTA